MPLEIEYKYLVKADEWKNVVPDESIKIKQAYLLTDPEKTIRVRTKGDKAFVTIKGKATGATRLEFEYEIPVADAEELIEKFSTNLIDKIRHLVKYDNNTWEVDEFKGANAGLIVAEIELNSEDESYALPEWIDKDVTDDMRYANSSLSVKPYSTW
jgi:adenylate cyclase